MKQKRMYEQPRTEVVELHVASQLLVGSTLNDLSDYGTGTDPFGTASPSRMMDDELEMLMP